jgi:aminoacylase
MRSFGITDQLILLQEKWKYGPFSADKDANGNIYARGSQDMKCVGIQYLEAIRRLKKAGVKLSRTLHISFVPGELTQENNETPLQML